MKKEITYSDRRIKNLQIPGVKSNGNGTSYSRDRYEIEYAKAPIRGTVIHDFDILGKERNDFVMGYGKNYYDATRDAKRFDARMSTSAEELEIQRNSAKGEYWAPYLTQTALRLPKGRKIDEYELNPNSEKCYRRLVVEGDEEVGEVLVPEGSEFYFNSGRVVDEWDEVFGIPKTTAPQYRINEDNPVYFSFDPTNPYLKSMSEKDTDVVVGRTVINIGEGKRALKVVAGMLRSDELHFPFDTMPATQFEYRPVFGDLQSVRRGE